VGWSNNNCRGRFLFQQQKKNQKGKITQLPDLHKDRIQKLFCKEFGNHAEHIVIRSPGRVNLIGEHTDYNEGFVLPAAIDKSIIFSVAPRSDRQFHFVSADLNDELKGTLDCFRKSEKGWPNYLLGVIDQLQKAGFHFNGVNVAFGGDVPIGAGLSSSAAMEGGLIFALNEIFSLGIDKLSLVKMAQKAEHEYAGVKCGIMDQFINIFGMKRKVLKIDCRSLEYQHFPFEREDLQIILCETPTRRSLASSEYNTRRKQCETGVASIQKYDKSIKSLRDVTIEMLSKHRDGLDQIVYKRCEYVVRENERVIKACDDLKRNDLTSFGKRMFESHAGLRDDYGVSSKELDILVKLASEIDGVLGSRMMGAGFGGCTINLVEESKAEKFSKAIKEQYHNCTNEETKVHITKLTGGTERVD
jgi:galactokinase